MRHSDLKVLILTALAIELTNIAEIAQRVGKHRSSVSRCLHTMEKNGLVCKLDGVWTLTEEGESFVEAWVEKINEENRTIVQAIAKLAKSRSFLR